MPKPLPVPSAREVLEFARLYKERFDVELSPEEAHELAKHYLWMYLICTS
jgi:hypothetical protein